MSSDVDKINDLWDEYVAACHAGDNDRFMELWTDDAIRMAPDTPQRVGIEQIREQMQPGFDLFVMSNMILIDVEVQVLGDRAYSHGNYTFDMAPKGGGEITSYSGKFLDILEKQEDGSWKIAIDCHNYNMPTE